MGKPYKESFDEVSWSAERGRYYAEIARHETARCSAGVDGQFHLPPRTRSGVCDHPAFNYPLCLLLLAAAAALASGNA